MPRLLLGGSLFLAVLCLAPARAQAPQTPAVEKPSENQTERLAALGKLWGAVKFFHPFLAYRDIDWDGALVKAIPRVKAARTPADYRMAIAGMLEVLGDPATRVEMMSAEPPPARAAPAPPADSTYFHVVDGYVVVDAASLTQAMARGAASPGQVQLQAEIDKATGVVLDCRFANAQPNNGQSFFLNTFLTGLLPMIVEGSASLGTARYRLHNGYPPQQGNSSGGYSSSFVSTTPNVIVGQAKERKPLAFLVDEDTPEISAILSGVQAAGAAIVRIGRAGTSEGARTTPIPMPDGIRVTLRVADLVYPTGDSTLQPDLVLTNEVRYRRGRHPRGD